MPLPFVDETPPVNADWPATQTVCWQTFVAYRFALLRRRYQLKGRLLWWSFRVNSPPGDLQRVQPVGPEQHRAQTLLHEPQEGRPDPSCLAAHLGVKIGCLIAWKPAGRAGKPGYYLTRCARTGQALVGGPSRPDLESETGVGWADGGKP